MDNNIIKSLVTGFIIFLTVWACQPPPELPVIPKISYNRMEFHAVSTSTDSLLLYLDFEDGDGDIGLEGNENGYPYHPFNVIMDKNRRRVSLSGTGYEPPFYSIALNPRTWEPYAPETFFSETDNRPSFNCENYEILQVDPEDPMAIDTVYVEKNPNNKNIYVEFYRKINGSYEFIDWANAFSTNSCGTDFNARFPIFDENNIGKSLTGTLRYAMLSEGFEIILKKDTFKVRAYIKDRALHDSNYAESPDLTLDMIRAN